MNGRTFRNKEKVENRLSNFFQGKPKISLKLELNLPRLAAIVESEVDFIFDDNIWID